MIPYGIEPAHPQHDGNISPEHCRSYNVQIHTWVFYYSAISENLHEQNKLVVQSISRNILVVFMYHHIFDLLDVDYFAYWQFTLINNLIL